MLHLAAPLEEGPFIDLQDLRADVPVQTPGPLELHLRLGRHVPCHVPADDDGIHLDLGVHPAALSLFVWAKISFHMVSSLSVRAARAARSRRTNSVKHPPHDPIQIVVAVKGDLYRAPPPPPPQQDRRLEMILELALQTRERGLALAHRGASPRRGGPSSLCAPFHFTHRK